MGDERKHGRAATAWGCRKVTTVSAELGRKRKAKTTDEGRGTREAARLRSGMNNNRGDFLPPPSRHTNQGLLWS